MFPFLLTLVWGFDYRMCKICWAGSGPRQDAAIVGMPVWSGLFWVGFVWVNPAGTCRLGGVGLKQRVLNSRSRRCRLRRMCGRCRDKDRSHGLVQEVLWEPERHGPLSREGSHRHCRYRTTDIRWHWANVKSGRQRKGFYFHNVLCFLEK